ncbi:MAG: YdcF family protein [Nevskia sp.]|nr:YdcF family protein [Nevskia sp.]
MIARNAPRPPRRLRLLLALLALEGLAFATPLVEWVAWPLRVPAQLHSVDAIVVLGSGVLPGGRPPPWAEERIRYGAQLYRAGYAPRIVFSGGMTGRSRYEPLGMLQWWVTGNYPQLEAESYAVFAQDELGLPPWTLVLEDQSHTTYENATRTASLLRRRGWRRVLLVTSPMHMRRALATFARLGVAADPAPVIASRLYSPVPADRYEAWRAVLHEYLGLLDYWLTGRIGAVYNQN